MSLKQHIFGQERQNIRTSKAIAEEVQRQNQEMSGCDLEEVIRKRAYELYLEQGEDYNGGISHWLQAEREIRKIYKR